MSSIDQLRRTLEEHASAVHDDGAVGRADAARTRARHDRRQRVAAVALAAVVAVVASVTIAVWPRSSEPVPADRVVNGHEAPATITSLGYTYRFVRAVDAPDGAPAQLFLRGAAEPRLISWAVGSGRRASIHELYGDLHLQQPSEFDDFSIVPPATDAQFRVTGERPALAVYELVEEAPGYTVDGITYRDEVAGATLVGAAISRPGDDELSFEVDPADGPVTARVLCAGGGPGTTVHVELDGREFSSTGCSDGTFDPAGQGSYGLPRAATPRKATIARVWVTTRGGDAVSEPGLRFGVGIYDEPAPGARLAAGDIPERQEADGHTWVLSGSVESDLGDRSVTLERPGNAPTIAYFFATRTGATQVQTVVDGRPGTRYSGGSIVSGSVSGPRYLPGSYGVRLGADAGPQARVAIAVYDRID